MASENRINITKIESWFPFGNRDLFKKSSHSNDDWSTIDLNTILMLATTNKIATYTAYIYNYSGFRDFCDNVWNTNILDLTVLTSFTNDQHLKILWMFRAVSTVVYPPNLPNSALDVLPRDKHVVMNINSFYQINRAITSAKKFKVLTIVGDRNHWLCDPLLDILLSFPRGGALKLVDIAFNKWTIKVLGANSYRKLIITEKNNLTKAILRHSNLKYLALIARLNGNSFFETIDDVIRQGLQLTKLLVLRVSIDLTDTNIMNISQMKSLLLVIIHEIPSNNSITREMAKRMLGNHMRVIILDY